MVESWKIKATVENRIDPDNIEIQEIEWIEEDLPINFDGDAGSVLIMLVQDTFEEENNHRKMEIIELNIKREKLLCL